MSPDILLHYTSKPNIFGSIAAGRLGIKNIAVVTGLGYAFIHNGLLQTITRRLYAYASQYTNQFIFENEDDLALFQREIFQRQLGVAVKGCGVDTKYYTNDTDIPNDVTVFTFIGRLLTDKGINEYLAAAKQLKKQYGDTVIFNVVGEVDKQNPASITYDSLMLWIDAGIITYHGYIQDVRKIIAESSCVVLPSYREGMPRTMLESLSMSRAVITTNVPGCRETVVNGINGYLAEAKSVESLAECMRTFTALTLAKKAEMGRQGRNIALKLFDSSKIATDIYAIIDAVAK